MKKRRKLSINIKLIEEYMSKNNFDIEKFAKYSALKKEDIEEILKNEKLPPLYLIVRLSRVMNIDYEKLFINKGIEE